MPAHQSTMSAKFTFADLDFKPHPGMPGSVQARADFGNGYGASVIRGPYSYGGDQGLYELAVMRAGRLCYDTPITDDVEGHLTPDDVTGLLAKIEALPKSEAL